MKTLSECPNNVRHRGSAGWLGSLRDRKAGMELQVSATSPFALHSLDSDDLIPSGLRCDGVLVADNDEDGLTCFIELKGTIASDAPDHPFMQIRGAIEHFAPAPDGSHPHGEEHHAAWRNGADVPVAPRGRGKPKALAIGPDHQVAGAIVVMRGGARHPARWLDVAGRVFFVAVIQKHGSRGKIALTLDDLQTALGKSP